MRQTGAAAAIGVCAAAAAYVVEHHYLHVEWVIDAPVPVGWWVLGGILGVLGVPLLLVALGRRACPLLERPWTQLLLTWVLPCLAAHVVWLGLTLAVLRRFSPGLTGVPARGVAEILPLVVLPPAELSLLWALALAPVVARSTRRVPVALVIVVLCALTALTPAPAFLAFLLVGLRLHSAIDHLAEPTTWKDLASRGAIALAGAAAPAVGPFPDGPATVVAGLAALPLTLTAVARLRRSRLEPIGGAAVPIFLLLIPMTALVDHVLLARLSASAPGVQYVAAVVEPPGFVAAVVAAGVLTTVLLRRVLHRDTAPVLGETSR
ncbi:hypothetical protein BJF90_23620 [Pseudonocardia sp. CNS-004]|nr:hypothetical protein BJF90_23620 [Pseudonocardia sp. CNS-004]